MPINPARLEKLKALGLTEYQARAYLALLDLGVAPAKDVASLSRVPKSKIYSTLDQLHDKGLLDIIPEHPKRYRVLNIDVYLTDLVKDYQDRLGYIRDRKGEIVTEFNPRGDVSLEERGSFSVLKGRRNVETKIEEMALRAQEGILVYGTPMAPRRLVHVAEALEEARRRGVPLRVIAPRTAENEESLARLARLGDISQPPPEAHAHPGVTLVVVDGKEALLAHAIPDDAHFYQGDDVAVWTNDPALAATLSGLAGQRNAVPGAPAEPRGAFVLPEDLRRVAVTQGHDPVTFLRLLGETLSAALASGAPHAPHEAGRALGDALAVRLLDDAKADPGGVTRAAARLFRDTGLGEVTFDPGPRGLEATLTPDPRGGRRAPLGDVLRGILAALAERAAPVPAGAPQGEVVKRS